MKRPLGLALVGLLVAVPVLAQSLAELAAREKERRKKAGGTAQTFTDDDLKKDRVVAPSPEPAAGAEAVSTSRRGKRGGPGLGDYDQPKEAATFEPEPVDDEQWRTTAAQLRDAIAKAEKAVAEAQKKLDAIPSGVGQPQPSDGLRQLPVSPYVKEPAYEAAEKELADAKAAVVVAKTALGDFEEKARKAGVPPGWIR